MFQNKKNNMNKKKKKEFIYIFINELKMTLFIALDRPFKFKQCSSFDFIRMFSI